MSYLFTFFILKILNYKSSGLLFKENQHVYVHCPASHFNYNFSKLIYALGVELYAM